MATRKQFKAAILVRRTAKGLRKKRTLPEPRQYTVADLERARDRVEAAERRIDNDRTNNPNRGRAGLERAQLELAVIEAQLRLRGPLSNGSIELFRHPGEHVEGPRSRLPCSFGVSLPMLASCDLTGLTTLVRKSRYVIGPAACTIPIED